MKRFINFCRVFVGILFIFSGLIKANDPLSLGYKMQEFFEVWTDDLSKGSFFLNHPLINLFSFLHEHTLPLAVIIIAFEIVAGAALLLGWRMKLFSWLLLLLIIFFTFLTGYAYFSGKFKNCGCFGDCIPLSPFTSLLKDLLLLVMISLLMPFRNKIRPVFPGMLTGLCLFIILLLSFGIQWYTLTYLPFADCLPFKKGKNISEQMKTPPGERPDSFAIRFIYEKGGKQFEFSPSDLPSDLGSYNFVKRTDKLIQKGNAEPPIKGFELSGETDVDSTQYVLEQPYAILLFCENFSVPLSRWKNSFADLYAEATTKNIPAYIITTQPREAAIAIQGTAFSSVQVFKCDYTAIRTAARTNPCIYLLKAGTIVNKWSYKRINNVLSLVKNIPVQAPPPPSQ